MGGSLRRWRLSGVGRGYVPQSPQSSHATAVIATSHCKPVITREEALPSMHHALLARMY
jgi:hypothetical protein